MNKARERKKRARQRRKAISTNATPATADAPDERRPPRQQLARVLDSPRPTRASGRE
jgi:hypothetical protein